MAAQSPLAIEIHIEARWSMNSPARTKRGEHFSERPIGLSESIKGSQQCVVNSSPIRHPQFCLESV